MTSVSKRLSATVQSDAFAPSHRMMGSGIDRVRYDALPVRKTCAANTPMFAAKSAPRADSSAAVARINMAGSSPSTLAAEPIAIGEISTFLPDSHLPVSTTR